jgi:hypothetical protein
MYSPRTTAFYTEFPVADARADVLLVNGDATVVEIKTKYDDASRLESQLRGYFRSFTRVTVLTDPSWADEYLSSLPEHIGVSVLNPRAYLTELRPARDSVDDLRHADMYQLFRQSERRKVSSDLGVDLTAVDPAEEFMVGLECFARQPAKYVHGRLVATLRSRQPTVRLAELCERLPPSLHAGVFGYRLRKRDWDDLIGVLAAPLNT